MDQYEYKSIDKYSFCEYIQLHLSYIIERWRIKKEMNNK